MRNIIKKNPQNEQREIEKEDIIAPGKSYRNNKIYDEYGVKKEEI